MNNKRVNILFFIFIDVMLSSICFLRCYNISGYEWVCLLPLAHVVTVLLPNFRYMAHKYIGIKFLYYTIIARYCVLPLSIAFSTELTGVGRDPDAMNLRIATFLMILELIVVTGVVTYFGQKKLIQRKAEQIYRVQYKKNESHLCDSVIILLAIICIIIHPDLMNNFSFIVYNVETDITSYFRGMDIRIIQIAIILFFCLFTLRCKIRYDKSKKIVYYFLALCIGVICMLIFKGENRASLLINIVSVCCVLVAAFPEEKNKTIKCIVITGMVSLTLLSLYRMLAITAWRPAGGSLDFSFTRITRTIQAYLSGPRNIAIGLEAVQVYPSSFKTFYSDVLIWTGYLGNYIAELFEITYEGTSYLFNLYLYGTGLIDSGDQIVPLCIQSIWYFGYLGSMLFSIIIAYFVVHFDYLICKSVSLGEIYINTMMAVVTGLLFGYNISIIAMYFMDRYILAWFVIWLSTKWSIHIRIRKVKIKIR